jgi:hypothetical protein
MTLTPSARENEQASRERLYPIKPMFVGVEGDARKFLRRFDA